MGKDTKTSSLDAYRALESRAIELASQESKEMSTAMAAIVKAKEDWEGGPIACLFAMNDTYGLEKMKSFPIVGMDSGNNPAIIKAMVSSANSDKKVAKTTDFYLVFPDNTKEGKDLIQSRNWLKLLANPESDKSGIPPEFKAKYNNPQARGELESFLTRRINTIRTAYKKAMQLFHAMDAINTLPHVACDFVFTDEAQTMVINNAKPIRIENPKNAKTDWDDYSVSSVLKMNVPRALENGGTRAALEETLTRAKKKDGQGGTEAATLIRTPTKLEAIVSDMREAFSFMMEDPKQEMMGSVISYLNKKQADQAVADLVDLRNDITALLEKVPNVAKRHARVTAENNEVEETINGTDKETEAA